MGVGKLEGVDKLFAIRKLGRVLEGVDWDDVLKSAGEVAGDVAEAVEGAVEGVDASAIAVAAKEAAQEGVKHAASTFLEFVEAVPEMAEKVADHVKDALVTMKETGI